MASLSQLSRQLVEVEREINLRQREIDLKLERLGSDVVAVTGEVAAMAETNLLTHFIAECNDQFSGTWALKNKSLVKFGFSDKIDNTGWKTVAYHPAGNPTETLLSSDTALQVSSSDNSDAGAATGEGHTFDGTSDLTFRSDVTATLTGQTAANLSRSLSRITRFKNAGSADWAGDIYIFESGTSLSSGVPTDLSKVHLMIPAGYQQSEKCQTAFSSVDAGGLAKFYASLDKPGSTTRVQVRIEVKAFGGVWLPLGPYMELDSGINNANHMMFPVLLVVAPNTDVRVVAKSDSGTDSTVRAGLYFYLATNA